MKTPKENAAIPDVVDWSVRQGQRLVACGRARGTEREVLEKVLRGELVDAKLDPDKPYSVRAGGSAASAYGDEFEKVASASTLNDQDLQRDGYLFASPTEEVDLEEDWYVPLHTADPATIQTYVYYRHDGDSLKEYKKRLPEPIGSVSVRGTIMLNLDGTIRVVDMYGDHHLQCGECKATDVGTNPACATCQS